MGKIIIGLVSAVIIWSNYMGQALAEGPLDIPSQTYTDYQDRMMQLSLASNNYVRAFTCNGASSWTKELESEFSGYTWIINQGWKGYIQQGYSGLQTLGVVLNNTKIDFDYAYLAKKGYSGNINSYVKAIQATMNCLGYDPGLIDGIFGTKTDSAVKAFQQRKGILVDGVVGKQTYHFLSFASS